MLLRWNSLNAATTPAASFISGTDDVISFRAWGSWNGATLTLQTRLSSSDPWVDFTPTTDAAPLAGEVFQMTADAQNMFDSMSGQQFQAVITGGAAEAINIAVSGPFVSVMS